MGDLVESVRQSPAYGPVGILAGAGMWFGIRTVLSRLQLIDVRDLMNSFLAIMFSGMYIYTWMQGENPHDCKVQDNELIYELPLLVAGGYYLLNMFPIRSLAVAAHHLASIVGVISVIAHRAGANAANTFAFLVEAPAVLVLLSVFLGPDKSDLLPSLFKVVFFMTRLGALSYHTYLVISNEAVPDHLKVLQVVLVGFSALFIPSVFRNVSGGKEEPKCQRKPSPCRPYRQNRRSKPSEYCRR